MPSIYLHCFWELIQTPFLHLATVWGIVPLYFGLLLNELTSAKASYRTALQTGFSFIWAGAQWVYPWFRHAEAVNSAGIIWPTMPAINLCVRAMVIVFGIVALISGVRKRFPKHCSFLGHSRFSNYFMITIFPIQAHYLAWTWERFIATGAFAVPVWLLLHF